MKGLVMKAKFQEHIVLTKIEARKYVSKMADNIKARHYSDQKLKSRKMTSQQGRYHENLKTAQSYINKEFSLQKNAAIRAYSKERATEFIESAVFAFTKAKINFTSAWSSVKKFVHPEPNYE